MPVTKTVAEFETAITMGPGIATPNPWVRDVLFGMKKPGADRAILIVKLDTGKLEVWDVG